MQYIALIYRNESEAPEPDSPEAGELWEAYGKFTQGIIAEGVFKGGDALQRSDTATCVKLRDGEVITTDGPFAETKEQLGGYYVLDCRDLDHALACAAKIPGAATGSVEVRPLVSMDG